MQWTVFKKNNGFTRNPAIGGDSGQTLLITLLVLTIATTIGLSLVARSTTDTAVSTQVEDSARAFSAAEAGIEEALKSGKSTTFTLSPDVTFTVSVTSVGSGLATYEFPQKASRGRTQTLWLVNHADDGTLVEQPTYTSTRIDVCWSSEETTPAVEVTVLYKESTATGDDQYRVVKGAYDSDVARQATNNFVTPTATTGGCGATTGTTYRQRVNFTTLNAEIDPTQDTLIALRVQPIYSDAKIVVTPVAGGELPPQGKRVESVGTTTGGVNRKILVNQEYRAPSELFDYVIYSQSDFGHSQ